jgi:cardiolipin synthase
VAEFQKLFLDTWQKQKGPKLAERNYFPDVAPINGITALTKLSPAGKAQETPSNLLKEKGNALVRVVGSTPGETNRIPFIVYVSAISFAEHSIHMTNSYFFPDDQIVKALTDAAGRGVDVKIILPGITDSLLALYAQRYHYSRLLKSGVKLYERNTPCCTRKPR